MNEVNLSLSNYFQGKVVLITGSSGFKGSWLSIWLNHLGAKVVGLSLDVPSTPSNFTASSISDYIDENRLDVCNTLELRQLILDTQPDFIFHLAAQALVRPSYFDPIKTIQTNAIGSSNILDSLRFIDKKVVAVMITSDKVYDNVEWVWGYKETDRLGGKDPYSASKGMAELAIRTYVESYFNNPNSNIRVGIARAGNVIGGGDWAVDRIVPDCIRAWSNNKRVEIRNSKATRPWQHVLEPLSGYIKLAVNLHQRTTQNGQAYNFGPSSDQNYPVIDLISEMSKYWDNAEWIDLSGNLDQLHEAGLLKLNCDKALFDIGWHSTLNFEETVKMTVEWYKHYYLAREKSMYNFTVNQIEEYTMLANSKLIS